MKKYKEKLEFNRKKVVILIALIVSIVGLSIIYRTTNGEAEGVSPKIVFNVGRVFEYGELIEDTEQIIDKSQSVFDKITPFVIETEEVGFHEVNVESFLNNNKKTFQYTYEVKDTQFPEIVGIQNKEILLNEEINLLEGITATDPIDGELEVVTTSKIDTSKSGSTTVVVLSKDKNGNKSEKSYEVIVKENEDVVSNPPVTQNDNPTNGGITPVPEKPKPTPVPEKPKPTPVPEKPKPTPVPEKPKPTPEPEKPDPTPVPEQSYHDENASQKMAILINEARAREGLPLFSIDSGDIKNSANRRSKEISENYSHGGAGYAEALNRQIGNVNINGAVNSWLRSPLHKALLLTEGKTSFSTSVYVKDGSVYYVVLVQSYVQ